MPALTPARAFRVGLWLVGGVFAVAIALGIRPASSPENPAYDALSKALTRRIAADSVALVAADSALATAQAKVAPAIVRYRTARDTVLQHLTDTVRVKEYVAHADSVVRSCTELSESCERFRVRSDSLVAGLRLANDALAQRVSALQPSRTRSFLAGSLPIVAFVGGVWIGSRAVR